MSLLVGQVARVDSDDLAALLAGVRELALVALNAVRLLLLQHIALAGQIRVAVPTQKVVDVETFVHGLQVFVGEDELREGFHGRKPARHLWLVRDLGWQFRLG